MEILFIYNILYIYVCTNEGKKKKKIYIRLGRIKREKKITHSRLMGKKCVHFTVMMSDRNRWSANIKLIHLIFFFLLHITFAQLETLINSTCRVNESFFKSYFVCRKKKHIHLQNSSREHIICLWGQLLTMMSIRFAVDKTPLTPPRNFNNLMKINEQFSNY